jgi:hypothetical protein
MPYPYLFINRITHPMRAEFKKARYETKAIVPHRNLWHILPCGERVKVKTEVVMGKHCCNGA